MSKAFSLSLHTFSLSLRPFLYKFFFHEWKKALEARSPNVDFLFMIFAEKSRMKEKQTHVAVFFSFNENVKSEFFLLFSSIDGKLFFVHLFVCFFRELRLADCIENISWMLRLFVSRALISRRIGMVWLCQNWAIKFFLLFFVLAWENCFCRHYFLSSTLNEKSDEPCTKKKTSNKRKKKLFRFSFLSFSLIKTLEKIHSRNEPWEERKLNGKSVAAHTSVRALPTELFSEFSLATWKTSCSCWEVKIFIEFSRYETWNRSIFRHHETWKLL